MDYKVIRHFHKFIKIKFWNQFGPPLLISISLAVRELRLTSLLLLNKDLQAGLTQLPS